MESSGTVRVRALLTSTGHLDTLLEQIVSRLGLEPGVTAVSWEIVAEHE
jgi:putative Mg2+ transporter-C (MgtC) family protein